MLQASYGCGLHLGDEALGSSAFIHLIHHVMKSILFRATLALCLLIYVGIGAFAQHSETTGSIVGTVVDASTHEALPYVQIIIKGTTVGTTTDANGAFILPNLRPGTYILEARLLGYALESSGVAIQAGHSRHHDFYLPRRCGHLCQ